jgi:hypothetical protein
MGKDTVSDKVLKGCVERSASFKKSVYEKL